LIINLLAELAEIFEKELNQKIAKRIVKDKNKKRIADVVEPWFVDQYYPRLMKCNSEDYIFYPEEKNRTKLYERIRKNF